MLTLLLSAAFPVAVFLIVIYNKDTVKEPPGLLVKCFIWGCIATVPILFIELLLDGFNLFEPVLISAFYDSFVVAAAVEEGFKFLFLYLIIWKSREFDQHFDGIVYAVFVSLGFALIENIFYVLEGGLGIGIMRAVLSIPGHGLFGVVMGYFFALARFSGPGGKKILWLSFLAPVFLHGAYNFLLSLAAGIDNGLLTLLIFAGFIAFMVFLWRLGIKNINKQRAKDLERKSYANPYT